MLIDEKMADSPLAQTFLREKFPVLMKESARGSLLVVVGHIETVLEDFYKALFAGKLSKKPREEVLGFHGPLGSLSARVKLAVGCGFLPPFFLPAMNGLRGARNDAAHGPEHFNVVDAWQKILDGLNEVEKGLGKEIEEKGRGLLVAMVEVLKSKGRKLPDDYDPDSVDEDVKWRSRLVFLGAALIAAIDKYGYASVEKGKEGFYI